MPSALLVLTALAAPCPLPDTFARQYKADTATSYTMTADVDVNGSPEKLEMELLFKVLKAPVDGKAECQISVTKLRLNDNDTDGMLTEPLTTMFDPQGLPDAVPYTDFEKAVALFMFSGYAPSGDPQVDKEYVVDWAPKDKSGHLKGTGKLTEVKTVEDRKVGVFKHVLEYVPDGGEAGKFTIVSEIDAETGALLRAEGDLAIEEVTGKFRVVKGPSKS